MCERTSQCPQCGRFSAKVHAFINEMQGIIKVVGTCSIHGEVDISDGNWAWEDFEHSEEEEP